jgi:hypothetical protein
LLASVVVIILIGATFAYYYATASSNISSLNGQVITLKEQASSLNGQVSSLNGQVTSLNGQVSSLKGISSQNVQLKGNVNAYGYSVTSILFTSDNGHQITTSPSQGSYSVSLPNDNWYSITVTYSMTVTYTITNVSFSCTGPSCVYSVTTTTETDTCSPPRLLVNVTSLSMTDDITC